ncbi:hypothetical protein DRQ26_02800 [bacterium]|nr:MAG: hypothetical protein DRQ26_02800 [bacterium]
MDFDERMAKALELIAEAEKLIYDGDYGEGVVLVQNAVESAVKALEGKYKAGVSGKDLMAKFARFTDDAEILNSAKVIDDFFSTTLYPVGFDTGTEEYDISQGKALLALKYGKYLINFVQSRISQED